MGCTFHGSCLPGEGGTGLSEQGRDDAIAEGAPVWVWSCLNECWLAIKERMEGFSSTGSTSARCPAVLGAQFLCSRLISRLRDVRVERG